MRQTLEEMADVLAEWFASGTYVTPENRQEAMEALMAIGVVELFADLELAERILRTGNEFHTVANFFLEDTAERDYLMALNASS